MNCRLLLMSFACCGAFGTTASHAADSLAIAARTKVIVVRQGSLEISAFETIEDLETTDRLMFILLGTGRAKLTVADADETGDTISVSGTFMGVQPASFTAAATSPNEIVQQIMTTSWGVLTVDIGYSHVVNGLPARYFYKLEF